MAIEKILVVDDEPLIRQFLSEALKKHSYFVDAVTSGKEALSLIKQKHYDLLLTDLKMPDINGVELLRKAKELLPSLLVVILTAYGTIESAVEAMQIGAFHYLLKPFSVSALEAVLDRANEHLLLLSENSYLKEQVGHKQEKAKIVAESPKMATILEEVRKIAKSQASVLIYGESGTGKEVIAGAIHAHSLRSKRPFIRVNCAAVPDTLIESEFFGHEKGAFTGASTKRMGRFELADGGTLLLDEVTEIPITLQPKLLRVIQEREFERVGGGHSLAVDVRLISTSNRNLKEAIEKKIFREDLYYRLNVVPIFLPPLRERKEDIMPLATHFLELFCDENKKKKKSLSKGAIAKLLDYHWPGNVRELANVMERIVVRDLPSLIDPSHILLE